MGLIVSTFMLGLGNIQGGSVVSAILIGNLGAIIGSVVSTRLMLMQTKKIFGTEEYVEDSAFDPSEQSSGGVRKKTKSRHAHSDCCTRRRQERR